MTDYPVLETSRLVLKSLHFRDAEAIQSLANQREVAMNVTPLPYPYTLQDARDWIIMTHAELDMKTGFPFGIWLKAEDKLIGAIEIGNEFRHRRGELGYWLGLPHWGQGYATEAARRVLEFAFEMLGLNRVFATHYARNPASGRVMQKIGMTYEGTLRGQVVKWGEPIDLLYYGILREEYDRAKNSL